jgi:hypothetical protein
MSFFEIVPREILPFVGSTIVYLLWYLFLLQTKVNSSCRSIDQNHKAAIKVMWELYLYIKQHESKTNIWPYHKKWDKFQTLEVLSPMKSTAIAVPCVIYCNTPTSAEGPLVPWWKEYAIEPPVIWILISPMRTLTSWCSHPYKNKQKNQPHTIISYPDNYQPNTIIPYSNNYQPYTIISCRNIATIVNCKP